MDAVVWVASTLLVWILSIAYLVVPLVKRRLGTKPSASGAGHGQVDLMPPLPIPRGAPAALAPILSATNYYQVLGVDQGASEETLRQAKRSLTLITHPDKVGNAPGAPQACQRVLEASKVLLDPQKRAEYDDQVETTRMLATHINLTTALDKTQSILMACDSCPQGMHQLPCCPNLNKSKARWCAGCRVRHSVSEGESWVEVQRAFRGLSLGNTYLLYTCFQGLVYDATVLGTCCGLLEDWARAKMPSNPCINPLTNLGNVAHRVPNTKQHRRRSCSTATTKNKDVRDKRYRKKK
jgi:hypothetical protein